MIIESYEESRSKETEIMFYECVLKETKVILVLNYDWAPFSAE